MIVTVHGVSGIRLLHHINWVLCLFCYKLQARQPIFVQLLQAAVRVHQQLTTTGYLTVQQRFNIENTIRTLSDYGEWYLVFYL